MTKDRRQDSKSYGKCIGNGSFQPVWPYLAIFSTLDYLKSFAIIWGFFQYFGIFGKNLSNWDNVHFGKFPNIEKSSRPSVHTV